MTDHPLQVKSPDAGQAFRRILIGLAVLVAAMAVAFIVVFRFVDIERQRDLYDWQVRLAIVSDSRQAAVEQWLEKQYAELNGLAQNASLQLYMTEILPRLSSREELNAVAAERAYLHNLLIVTAERAKFKGQTIGADVDVNVARIGVAGLALLDMNGRVAAATDSMPPLEGALHDFVTGLPRGQRGLMDIFKGPAGNLAMGFVVPVFSIHGDGAPSDQIGVVLGVKEVATELYPLLSQPGEASKSTESLLVRRQGGVVEYISPLRDGTPPLVRKLALDTPELAAAYALSTPGGFAIKRDYTNTDVLVISRTISAAPWTLLYKINREEALAGSDSRLARLTVWLILIVALITFALIAAWRWGASRTAESAAAAYRATAQALDEEKRFLNLLTDSQPNPIFILDKDGRYEFANAAAAAVAGIPVEDMSEKTVDRVLGPHFSEFYNTLTRAALSENRIQEKIHRIAMNGADRIFQSKFIPFADDDRLERVLVIEEDITNAVREREKHERILKETLDTLVGLVDQRDPNASEHSAALVTVAKGIAESMQLAPATVVSIETAARLMNLGKILIPRDILIKPDELTAEEMEQVLESMALTASLLEGIEFDGPVVDIIRQSHAIGEKKKDGEPLPEDVSLGAAIISLANAFIAMTSPRAHRASIEVEEALSQLMQTAESKDDRRVVAALGHFLENTVGREQWADLLPGMRRGRQT